MDLPLTNLRAFDAAARLLSFTQAAEALNLSQSAVSQQMKLLEDRLGLPLFIRLTRRLELTDDGRRLYETVRRALNEIDATVADLREATGQGRVTLSVGSSFAANWLIPRLGRFTAQHPGIDLRLKPSDVLIDLQSDRSIDIAVRFAQGPGLGLVSAGLAPESVFVVCSPALLGDVSKLRALGDLARFPLLHNEASEQEAGAAGDWGNWLAKIGDPDTFDVAAGARLPHSDLLISAAVHGLGMALIWTTVVRHELADGRLVKPFDGRFETTDRYYATCTHEAYEKPKVRAVLDWLVSESTDESTDGAVIPA